MYHCSHKLSLKKEVKHLKGLKKEFPEANKVAWLQKQLQVVFSLWKCFICKAQVSHKADKNIS